MPSETSIAWTDVTWNPTRGCSRVSEGCRNCYAERVAHRFSYDGGTYEGLTRDTANGPRWTGEVRLVPHLLDWPLRKRKPLRIFVNSMSDLFHESLSDEEIAAVFGVMAACPQHTFQILTKRAERLPKWFAWLQAKIEASHQVFPDDSDGWIARHLVTNRARHFGAPGKVQASGDDWPLPNVWLGVSVENQATADDRIPLLLQTPAAVRFLSCEPLLEPIRLETNLFDPQYCCWDCGAMICRGPGNTYERERELLQNCVVCKASLDGKRKLDWVIIGGESGPGARPVDVAWIRSVHDQCANAAVPVFVKQDSGRRSGLQGRIPDDLWVKEFPNARP